MVCIVALYVCVCVWMSLQSVSGSIEIIRTRDNQLPKNATQYIYFYSDSGKWNGEKMLSIRTEIIPKTVTTPNIIYAFFFSLSYYF